MDDRKRKISKRINLIINIVSIVSLVFIWNAITGESGMSNDEIQEHVITSLR